MISFKRGGEDDVQPSDLSKIRPLRLSFGLNRLIAKVIKSI